MVGELRERPVHDRRQFEAAVIMMSAKGTGAAIRFLREHIAFDGAECLLWPFSRDQDGYGQFGHEGKVKKPHRWMCEEVNGPPPTSEHQAAHECGNGEGGCIHPKHLSWKTPLENSRDKILHGTTNTGCGRRRNKLTPEQVSEIRKIDTVAGQFDAAKRYGVSASMVRKIIYGKAWNPTKPWKNFADEDVIRIRSLKGSVKVSDLAAEYEVKPGVIYKIWSGHGWRHVSHIAPLKR